MGKFKSREKQNKTWRMPIIYIFFSEIYETQ